MRRVLLVVALSLGVVGVVVAPAQAQARQRIAFHAPRRARATRLVTFTGFVGSSAGRRIVVQQRSHAAWTSMAVGRAGSHGRFALTWIAPVRPEKLLVRVVSPGLGTSGVRHLRVMRLPHGVKPVIVSRDTRVLSSTVVSSAPAPGSAGRLVYAGGNQLAAGQILAIGTGSATPDGFLGRVTRVHLRSRETVVSTVPATLLQAVRTGTLDLRAAEASVASAASASRPRATITCSGSAGMSVTHSVSFSTGLSLKGSWSWLHGLQSASVTASAKLNASLGAIAKAAGSCSLGSTPILTLPGPSGDGLVGPVPVVMTSRLTVDLSAGVSAQSSLSTGASAGFSATAGVGWTKKSGFYPIEGLSSHFGYTAPDLTAAASASVHVVPKIDVLLYGVVGPEISLNAGVAFNANTSQNPWWTLTAPIALTASVTIPPLGLSSPTLTLYRHSFDIAHASGAYTGGGGGTVVNTIPVGSEPLGVSSDGTHVWVTNVDDGTVSEIDASTGTVVNTISVGSGPYGVSSDGTHVWVANIGDDTVSEIDASTGTVVNTIPVGEYPPGVSSDGTHVWVTNADDDTVSEIDASTGTVVNTISVGSAPGGVSSDGTHVWVTNDSDDTVSEIQISAAP